MGVSGPALEPFLLFPPFADLTSLPFPTLDASQFFGTGQEPALTNWPPPGWQSLSDIAVPGGSALSEDSTVINRPSGWEGPGCLDVDWLSIEDQHHGGDMSVGGWSNSQPNEQPTPSHVDNPPLQTRQLCNLPTALSEFFFKEVIPLYCAWDSDLNLMRVVAENTWQSSKVLYHTMQSMAAACLTSVIPELSSSAVQERLVALRCLDDDPSEIVDNPEAKLLATVLLCHTASWHDPGNLARERYHATQKLVLEWSANATCTQRRPMATFFQTAVDYWGMLLSFFTDISGVSDNLIGPRRSVDQTTLHPFVGIGGQTIRTLMEVGNLVSQYRFRIANMGFITEEDMDFFKRKIQEARCLEKRLLAYEPADISKMQGTGDPRTPLMHLAKVDEAYRCVGLLQIYRVFSDLLAERYTPWDKENIYSVRPPSKTPSKIERDAWLTNLALYTLDLLRDIPFESRSRCIQPLILVAISSELRRVPQDITALGAADEESRRLGQDVIQMAQARNFVKSRLSAYADVLPLRKVGNILELVTSIWAALDEGESDVYWLDICTRKQLNTLIG